MDTNNRTVLLIDNSDSSKERLTSILAKNDALVMVVFGKNDLTTQVIETTNNLANSSPAGIGRLVVWMQSIELLSVLKALIKDGPAHHVRDITANTDLAITLSLNYQLAARITKGQIKAGGQQMDCQKF